MVGADVSLILPGEERGWELWRPGENRCRDDGLERFTDLPKSVSKTVVGLPARECTSFAVALPRMDPALLPEVAFAQLEKRGLQAGTREQTIHAFQVLDEHEDGVVLALDVLPPDFSEDLKLNRAVRYGPAARLHRLPDHKLVLTREQGSFVLLAGLHGKLAFSQVMTAGEEITPAFAQEINLALVSLSGTGFLHEFTALEVWVDLPAPAWSALRDALPIPVEPARRPRPDPKRLEGASSAMLPREVLAARERRRKARRLRRVFLALFAAFVVVAVLAMIRNQALRKVAEELEALIASRRERVRFIQESMARQRALEAAYDKRFYPAVQLNSVARLMPPSGVVIRKFVTQGQNLRIEGLARDPQLAFQLKEDLEKAGDFAGYSWDMAPPQMNQNNSAASRLQCTYAPAQK